MNPFWTIGDYAFSRHAETADAAPIAGIVLCAAAALQIPAMLRGVGEVLAASRARQQRQAGPAVHGAPS
jgi:hypothetical protein